MCRLLFEVHIEHVLVSSWSNGSKWSMVNGRGSRIGMAFPRSSEKQSYGSDQFQNSIRTSRQNLPISVLTMAARHLHLQHGLHRDMPPGGNFYVPVRTFSNGAKRARNTLRHPIFRTLQNTYRVGSPEIDPISSSQTSNPTTLHPW
jgi:hypothetical protein